MHPVAAIAWAVVVAAEPAEAEAIPCSIANPSPRVQRSPPGRRLWKLDGKWLQGTGALNKDKHIVPPRPVPYAPLAEVHVRLVHVPKTAGGSFLKDCRSVMPTHASLAGQELPAFAHRALGGAVLTVLRRPGPHVYSQFLECKYDMLFRKLTDAGGMHRGNLSVPVDGFAEWVRHFAAFASHPWPQGRACRGEHFGCYNPWNMQTRYHAYDPRCDMCGGAHDVCQSVGLEPDLAVAQATLDHMAVVGLTEHYNASLCLLEYLLTLRTEWCLQPRKMARVTHGVPRHSYEEDVPADLKREVAALVTRDEVLYARAKRRFAADVRLVQRYTGKELLREDTLRALEAEPPPVTVSRRDRV